MAEDLRRYGDPGSEEFRVDAYAFYLLNRAVSRYNVVIEAELRRIGLEIPTWRVLMVLGQEQPQPIARIARSAVINISTMMRIVERMERRGLIASTPSESDARVTDLSLTPHGREKLAEARLATAPIFQKLIRGFSARDYARLLEMLNRLHDNLD